MNKKTAVGTAVSIVLLVVFVAAIANVDWDDYTEYESPESVPTINPDEIIDESGELVQDSLAYSIFEEYGIVLIPLALLMFGAMIGGVCISREEVEADDSN